MANLLVIPSVDQSADFMLSIFRPNTRLVLFSRTVLHRSHVRLWLYWCWCRLLRRLLLLHGCLPLLSRISRTFSHQMGRVPASEACERRIWRLIDIAIHSVVHRWTGIRTRIISTRPSAVTRRIRPTRIQWKTAILRPCPTIRIRCGMPV